MLQPKYLFLFNFPWPGHKCFSKQTMKICFPGRVPLGKKNESGLYKDTYRCPFEVLLPHIMLFFCIDCYFVFSLHPIFGRKSVKPIKLEPNHLITWYHNYIRTHTQIKIVSLVIYMQKAEIDKELHVILKIILTRVGIHESNFATSELKLVIGREGG